MSRSRRGDGDGRRGRWEAHRAARRQELIAATIKVVRTQGPAVSMDDIAAAAGVAKPVFYRYFADKADLHGAVGRAVADVVVRRVTTALDGGTTLSERLAAAIDAYLRSVEDDQELYRFVVHGRPPSRDAADAVEDYSTVVGLHAARVIGTLLRQAGADAGAAEPWGFGIVGLVRTAADRWLASPTMSRRDLVGYLTALVEPGLASLAAGGEGAPPHPLVGPRPAG